MPLFRVPRWSAQDVSVAPLSSVDGRQESHGVPQQCSRGGEIALTPLEPGPIRMTTSYVWYVGQSV